MSKGIIFYADLNVEQKLLIDGVEVKDYTEVNIKISKNQNYYRITTSYLNQEGKIEYFTRCLNTIVATSHSGVNI